VSEAIAGDAGIGAAEVLLEIRHLKKYFPVHSGFLKRVVGHVKAVDDVSLSVHNGETLGLVGESGCGKTTLGRSIVRAIPATEGEVLFRSNGADPVDFLKADRAAMRSLRRQIQMIFQDPYSSLDPRMTVFDIIAEPLRVNRPGPDLDIDDRVQYLASVVGLNISHLKRYPHAFSGGQRQRIGIARALATNPEVVIADEPVSALDVSVQAQVLNLMEELQETFGLTYIFVAHDLSVIQHISDRVAVMYVGKVVELADTDALFGSPLHPYTEALMSAVPKPDPRSKMRRIVLEGEVPNPANPPSGCHFHPRCRFAKDVCRDTVPVFREAASNHFAACHFAGELALKGV
jgi:peptide/nickel transport system ATP-binding protein